ncbi:hypothetical protein ACIBX9_25660 [Streptomyces albidoflavus]|uniref:hypothetical protein n=1 Tax=Streptomyces albidoflavus TaxID=1886 RepID=UPI0010222AD9|nr:hypothetical protein [Streptomyces albidoflavus]RZF06030.1 hypothetical protein C0R05_24685 [Streptomyces albidoflavus]
MPKIRLAFWHGGRAPGEEVEVSDEEAAALQRDGRVAAVLTKPSPSKPVARQEPSEAQPEPGPAAPEAGGKKAR